ncbi:expressed unknown protein [Seminavis robusta]|uniref:Uncharacterized protein n=1 Tax=Seminavis robusta TaxID=568900 RepID=A0A9N8HQW9_9STRA|nr:expressed unknown protein [Seminavis robusta]|eukprot:Sro1495_g277420.1 n/a (377) ;mRNA; f:9060-10190
MSWFETATKIVVGNTTNQLWEQIRSIRRNDEGLTDIIVVLQPDQYHHEDFALFVGALGVNSIVEALCLLVEGVLPSHEVQALGNMFRTNSSMKRLYLIDPHNHQLQLLWQGVHSSQSLKKVDLIRVSAACVFSFLENRTESSRIRSFNFMKCPFPKRNVDSLLAQIFQPEALVHILSLIKCIFEAEEDKHRIALALAQSTSVEGFLLKDKVELNKETAAMFAHAIATNKALEMVAFHNLQDDALPIITQAVEQNHYLTHAQVSGKEKGIEAIAGEIATGDPEKDYKQKVALSIAMNKAGRRFLQDSIQRPGGASIEEFWLSSLAKINKYTVAYCWIRNYPDIFLRVAGLGEKREEKGKRKAPLHCGWGAKKLKTVG